MGITAAFVVPHPPLIIPDVGRGNEEKVRVTINSYEKIGDAVAKIEPETIVITSPHQTLYSDYFHISPGKGASGSFAAFGAPNVSFSEEYDTDLVDAISEMAGANNVMAGTMGEREPLLDHGTMVPLYFIRKKYSGGRIVRIGLSGFSFKTHYRFGMIIKEAVEKLGRKAVFIASGDLSHKLREDGPYGFATEGLVYDKKVMDVFEAGDFGKLLDFSPELCDRAAECGHRSFLIMAGALDGKKVVSRVYSHQDITGVGYGICSFYPSEDDSDRCFLHE